MKHQHKEAFCLMKYRAKDGSEEEILWNSRDGVTPFGITSRSGKEMLHVDFAKDRYSPGHIPKPGDRVFVDATPDLVRSRAVEYVDKWWDAEDPNGMGLRMSAHPFFAERGKDWAIQHFIAEWTKISPFLDNRVVAAIINPRCSRPFSMSVGLLEIHSRKRDNERV